MTKLLVIVAGPTASGKTELAINIAQKFNTSIVSADSRQFFREIAIGTAKPSAKELASVKHYFINSHSIADQFNAGSYAAEARELLNSLFTTNDVVVMVGGSGLYIDAVINGVDEFPDISEDIRNQLHQQYSTEGITSLQEQLQQIDPEYYAKVDVHNPQRLMRALEVFRVSGQPYSSFLGKNSIPFNIPYLMIGINWSRELLYQRIDKRVQTMIEQGLVEEVRSVLHWRNQNALRTVGYKEMFDYLDDKITLEQAVELIAKNTRNYAKRQLTWFRRYPELIWIQPEATDSVYKIIEDQLSGRTTFS